MRQARVAASAPTMCTVALKAMQNNKYLLPFTKTWKSAEWQSTVRHLRLIARDSCVQASPW